MKSCPWFSRSVPMGLVPLLFFIGCWYLLWEQHSPLLEHNCLLLWQFYLHLNFCLFQRTFQVHSYIPGAFVHKVETATLLVYEVVKHIYRLNRSWFFHKTEESLFKNYCYRKWDKELRGWRWGGVGVWGWDSHFRKEPKDFNNRIIISLSKFILLIYSCTTTYTHIVLNK